MKSNNWAEIVSKLTKNGLTITTMESCTGGGIANEITNISGASLVLRECFVTYCNEAKIKLGVSAEIIEKHSVYSEETAVSMAKAAKMQANADIAVGVTGQLGRIDPNNPNSNLNCVWYAIITKNNGVITGKITVPDEERKIQKSYAIEVISNVLLDNI